VHHATFIQHQTHNKKMTNSPWLDVDLNDYEGHMTTPGVGQSVLLAAEFSRAIDSFKPQSLGLIGCAGGNGLDALVGKQMTHVVCLDINSSYLSSLSDRYQGKIHGLEISCGEVESFISMQPLDLIFGGLIFEYTRLEEALTALSATLRPGGMLVALIQIKSGGVTTVSSSPYAHTLAKVGAAFNYIDSDGMSAVAAARGLNELTRRVENLPSGRSFTIIEFMKSASGETQQDPELTMAFS
jgi:Methyltransferase domain